MSSILAELSRRNAHLERKYGMTLLDYEALLEKQGHACAICHKSHSRTNPLHVDHCHKTGQVRGLLCTNCNTGLGKLGDSIPQLWAAIKYLMGDFRWPKRTAESFDLVGRLLSVWR